MKTRLFKKEHTTSKIAKVRRYILAHPELKCEQVAEILSVPVQAVYNARYTLRKHTKKTLTTTRSTKKQMPITMVEPAAVNIDVVHEKQVDMVNNPPHYKVGGIETYDILKAKLTKEELRGYLKGNVIKYVTRAGYKNASAEDAGKLAWYAQRLAELEA